METHARAPQPLIKDGDIASNWESWKEDFIIFMKVTGYINKPNETRANLLKNLIGRAGIEAIQNISFDNMRDKDNMDILMKKLDEYFNPPKKEVVERYLFFTASKNQNESIEHYINFLKEKAKACNFKDMADSIIRDKIILDTQDRILRQKLFDEDNLNLPKLIAIYNNYNINTEKMKQFAKYCCWRCGIQHPLKQCPAWGFKCGHCNALHHYTGRCKDIKLKMNNDKVNKNVLHPMQETKFTPKNKWNNQTDSAASINEMIALPDVPTTLCDAANSSVGKDSTIDFAIVNKHDISSKLYYDNTSNHSAHLPQSSQASHSYTKFPIKPDTIHNTNSKLWNNPTTHFTHLPKSTQNTSFTVKPDETHNPNPKLGNYNNITNQSAHLPRSTQNTSFTVKPDGIHNINSKLRNGNVTNQSAPANVRPTPQPPCLSTAQYAVKPDGTLVHNWRNEFERAKKKTAENSCALA